MMLSRLPLLSQSRARAARRHTCTLNSVTSCPKVLDTFRFAWNAVNSDHIDVQPNLYWEHIEVHVKYSGPNPANVVVASTLRLSIKAFTDYWLKIAAKDYGPGRGQLQVFWSTDGRAFEQAVIVTGLPDLTGMAGISTAGPHLPHTHFDDFRVEWQ